MSSWLINRDDVLTDMGQLRSIKAMLDDLGFENQSEILESIISRWARDVQNYDVAEGYKHRRERE